MPKADIYNELPQDLVEDVLNLPAIYVINSKPILRQYSLKKWFIAMGHTLHPGNVFTIMTTFLGVPLSFECNTKRWYLLPTMYVPNEPSSLGYYWALVGGPFTLKCPDIDASEFCIDAVVENIKENSSDIFKKLYALFSL